MSLTARRFHQRRHTCSCGRHALFTTKKNRHVRARNDHELCMRCYRSLAASARNHSKRRFL